ncbi:hypothetical protein GCM10027299_49700 [Larkinella ripae]
MGFWFSGGFTRAAAFPPPAGHPITRSGGAVPVNQQRYIGLTIFNFETDPEVDDERIRHSAGAGCNAVEITINWDRVYPTRQSSANWKVVDSHVQTALRHGLKIALRIHIGRELSRLGGFWGDGETMWSADGSRMDGGGITQFSFAHQATLELAKDFVEETTRRYRYLQQQNRLLFMSVVASPALESEYSPVHHKPDGTKYVVPFDYGDPMKQAFRDWLRGRFSLSVLNSRWSTGFGDWNAVTPPTGNLSDPYKLFTTNRQGQDWYVLRHWMLERYLNEIMTTVRSVDGSIRVVNQHGAVWDRLSGLRGTFAFKSLNRNADGLKFNDGPTYNHRFSMDVVRSNLKPGAFLINAVDGMFYTTVSVDTYFDQIEQCFEHGASMLTLANFGPKNARAPLTELIQRVVSAGLLDQPVTAVQTGGTISYKVSEIAKSNYGPIASRWNDQYTKSGKKPVQVHLVEDWLDDTDEPVQPDANQAPQIIKAFPDQTATIGKPFSLAVAESHFRDPDGSIARVDVSGLQAGLSYHAGTNLISGTPTAAVTLTVTVKATDNDGASVTANFRIRIGGETTAPPADPEPEEPETGGNVTGNFEGYLDKVECGTMRGWVWDRDRPNTPVVLEFYADGQRIGTTEADSYRADLKSAGKGDGNHAYSFTTPAGMKDGKTREISAKVLNSEYTLKWAPKELTCPSPARLAAESAERGLDVKVLGNPVGNQLAVELRGAEGKSVRFQVTDLQGRVVMERVIESAGGTETQRFSLAAEPPGLLFLRVATHSQAVTLKVIKQ